MRFLKILQPESSKVQFAPPQEVCASPSKKSKQDHAVLIIDLADAVEIKIELLQKEYFKRDRPATLSERPRTTRRARGDAPPPWGST